MEDEARPLRSPSADCVRSVQRVWSELLQPLRQLQYDELYAEAQSGGADSGLHDLPSPPPHPSMPAATLLSQLCACQRAYSSVLACLANVADIDNKCKVLSNELTLKQSQLRSATDELYIARSDYDQAALVAELDIQGTRPVPSDCGNAEQVQESVHDFDEDQRSHFVLMLAKLVKGARDKAVLEQARAQLQASDATAGGSGTDVQRISSMFTGLSHEQLKQISVSLHAALLSASMSDLIVASDAGTPGMCSAPNQQQPFQQPGVSGEYRGSSAPATAAPAAGGSREYPGSSAPASASSATLPCALGFGSSAARIDDGGPAESHSPSPMWTSVQSETSREGESDVHSRSGVDLGSLAVSEAGARKSKAPHVLRASAAKVAKLKGHCADACPATEKPARY